jgi:hypothetical protein
VFDRDGLLANVDLAALADELLGPRRGTQRSGSWPCPISTHAQTGRTPPVTVFSGKRGEQRWTCHGCGAGGTAIDLVMAVQGIGVRPALEFLAAAPAASGPARSIRAFEEPVAPLPDPRLLADLHAYVMQCARRLWRPSGRAVRAWLTEERLLPPAVLAANLVGSDPGPGLQARPPGVPRRSGAVFPAIEDGRAVYAQLRRLHPSPGQPRYLSVANRLASNPGLARYRPAQRADGLLIVTEGPTDALAAAAGGFEAAAVFGAGAAGRATADALAASGRTIVLAFDADEAGRTATARLSALLRERGCRPLVLGVPDEVGDLAAWLARSTDWPRTLSAAVRLASAGRDRSAEVSLDRGAM